MQNTGNNMPNLFHDLGEWFRDAIDSLELLVVFNFFWLILTIPVITAPPAAAGLFYATRSIAHRKETTWKTFFEGFRDFFWLSWRWGLTNLFITMLLVSNIMFYSGIEASWASWLQGTFFALLILWICFSVYPFPLLLEQEDRRVRIAFRNSVVLMLKSPVRFLGIGFILFGIGLLSTILLLPGWFVITASLIAFIANAATITLLEHHLE